jgi:gas vesicle protein GvpL/GvpF
MPAGRVLWLVVSSVPLDRYGPGQLETTLRDLDRVAEIAVAHEAVVEHFARIRRASVVPMKMFTMFSSDERAAAEMSGRRREIDAVMRRIADCEEWGVRVMKGRQPNVATPAAETSSGTAFLSARKRARDTARLATQQAAQAAATAFEELSPLARETRSRTGAPEGAIPPLLDAAFLIPSSRRTKFRAAARRAAKACAGAGAEMIVTGPWPAYNFVQPPGDSA